MPGSATVPRRAMTTSPCRAQRPLRPRARLWGRSAARSRPKGGEHRRVGAAAEREGFSAVLGALRPPALLETSGSSVQRRIAARLRAFESRHGSVRTLRQCSSLAVPLPHSAPEVRIPLARFDPVSSGAIVSVGICGEGGIRTLGTVAPTVRCSLATRAARFLPPPNSVLASAAAAARGMGEAVASRARYGKSSPIRSSTSGNAAGAICCSLPKCSAGL
jgi:hypothetical protein